MPAKKPKTISDPQQRRIYDRLLKLVGPCAAAFFYDAAKLMRDRPPYQSLTHLVAHLLRDVEKALRTTLEPLAVRDQDEQAREEKHKASVLRVCRALGLDDSDRVVELWLGLCGRENPRALHALAHHVAASPPRPMDSRFESLWRDVLDILDVVLARQEARFMEYVGMLDYLAAKNIPTKTDIATLKTCIPHSRVALDYFFERAPAGWLWPLHENSFFNHPTPAIHDEEQGLLEYPAWPQSRYLVRVSHQVPDAVRDVILQIPDTDNVYIIDDLIDAIAKMPVHICKDGVPRIIGWLEQPYGSPSTENLIKIVRRLAREGEVVSGLELARCLLQLAPHQTQSAHHSVEPRSRIDAWSYEDTLSEAIPTLLEADGTRTLSMLCDLLDQAVNIRMSNSEPGSSEDYSYIWHEEIESDRESGFGDVSNLLVAAVRDAAVSLVQENRITAREVVELLESRRWQVFRRIALHILRIAPERHVQMISERLLIKAHFDDMGEMEHEYTLLFKELFGSLSPQVQRRLCSWIEHGPDLDGFPDRYSNWLGRPATQEDIEEYVNRWRFRRLGLIADHLPDGLRTEYERLLPDYSDISSLDSHRRCSFGAWSPESPKSIEDLHSMDVAELVHYLGDWTGGDWLGEPCCEGLASTLETAVAMQPDRYASSACAFGGLSRPDYISAIMCGLRTAVDQDRPFEWEPVLDLCSSLAARVRDVGDDYVQCKAGRGRINIDWRSVLYGIASLMERAFSKDQCLDIGLRHKAWDVVECMALGGWLYQRSDDIQGTEQERASVSIDLLCREVLEAVIRYGLWILKRLQTNNPHYASSFGEDMPEVAVVLDHHLAVANSRPSVVHRVYGQWFPWLVLLDEQWAKRSVDRIFPDEVEAASLHDAAWREYLALCPPYNKVFHILNNVYSRAIEGLGAEDQGSDDTKRLEEHLVEHLMLLYLRGEIGLQGDDDLLTKLFARAGEQLRNHAISFMGRVLRNEESEFDDAMVSRLRALWEWRLSELHPCDTAPEQRSEASAFGWWFVSGRFDHQWAIHQLHDTIQLTGWVEPASRVLDRLSDYGEEFMGCALDCLECIADSSAQMRGYMPSFLVKPAKKLLGMAVGLEHTRSRAKVLANKLGAQGFVDEFRDIANA